MTDNQPMIAVHGATGTQGAAIAASLLDAGVRVRALSRRGDQMTGAEAMPVDLADIDSLTAGYTGADAVVVSLPLEFRADVARRQAEAVLAALVKSSVQRAVLLTNGPLAAGLTGVPFVDARHLVATELPSAVPEPHVVGVAGIYLQNLAAPWSLPMLRRGVAAYPLPIEAVVPWVDVADVAQEVARLATQGGPALQAVIGPEALTGDQLVEALSPTFGPVSWKSVSPAEYAAMLTPHLGRDAADGIAGMYEASPYPTLDVPLVPARTTAATWARGVVAPDSA